MRRERDSYLHEYSALYKFTNIILTILILLLNSGLKGLWPAPCFSESTWLLLERVTAQAVETTLEADQVLKQARSLALVKEDRGMQTEDGELKSPGARLQRRSGTVSGKAGQVNSFNDVSLDTLSYRDGVKATWYLHIRTHSRTHNHTATDLEMGRPIYYSD